MSEHIATQTFECWFHEDTWRHLVVVVRGPTEPLERVPDGADEDERTAVVLEPLSLFPIDPDLHVSETPTGPRRTELGRWGRATVLIGDVRRELARLAGNSVDFLCTSPPFLGLRSYLPPDHPDKHREIGSEPDPATFIDTLLALTAEWGRVLAPWGSIAVELGDTFSGSGGAGGDYNADGMREGQQKFRAQRVTPDLRRTGQAAEWARSEGEVRVSGGPGWPLAKSLCGIPQAYMLSLTYGRNVLNGNPSPAGQWRVRNQIVWARPNPSPGSLGKRNVETRTGDQRFRVATSYITVACRHTGRYFDLDAVHTDLLPGSEKPRTYRDGAKTDNEHGQATFKNNNGQASNPAGAPPLDWHADGHPEDGDWLWRLPTAPYKGAHYATYPLALPKRLIEAMCPRAVCTVCGWPSERITMHERTFSKIGPSAGRSEARTIKAGPMGAEYDVRRDTLGWTDCGHNTWRPGIVLDPFLGSGTTAAAALHLGRDATGIDIDHRNIDLIRQRIREVCEFGTLETA